MAKPQIHKKTDMLEAVTNSIGGYPVGFLVGLAILPLSLEWIQKDPIAANLTITMIYVSVSFVRTYFLRRIFSKYKINDNFLVLAISGVKRLDIFYRRKRSWDFLGDLMTAEHRERVAQSLKTYTWIELPIGIQIEMINEFLEFFPEKPKLDRYDLEELL